MSQTNLTVVIYDEYYLSYHSFLDYTVKVLFHPMSLDFRKGIAFERYGGICEITITQKHRRAQEKKPVPVRKNVTFFYCPEVSFLRPTDKQKTHVVPHRQHSLLPLQVC